MRTAAALVMPVMTVEAVRIGSDVRCVVRVVGILTGVVG